MTDDRAVQIALKLMKLGVSRIGVLDLLGHYPYEQIERQLTYLPYRRAKRPEALIVDAIRNDYSPPKEFYYASPKTDDPAAVAVVDQNTQLHPGSPDAQSQRYRTPDSPHSIEADRWLEQTGAEHHLDIPPVETENRPRE